MTFATTVRDQRLLARFVNVAHRCGCRYGAVEARDGDGTTDVRFTFTGTPDALRRLAVQLERLVADDRISITEGVSA